jgi:hypothetical protein
MLYYVQLCFPCSTTIGTALLTTSPDTEFHTRTFLTLYTLFPLSLVPVGRVPLCLPAVVDPCLVGAGCSRCTGRRRSSAPAPAPTAAPSLHRYKIIRLFLYCVPSNLLESAFNYHHMMLLHNGGFCIGCITKRCWHFSLHYLTNVSYKIFVPKLGYDKS